MYNVLREVDGDSNRTNDVGRDIAFEHPETDEDGEKRSKTTCDVNEMSIDVIENKTRKV